MASISIGEFWMYDPTTSSRASRGVPAILAVSREPFLVFASASLAGALWLSLRADRRDPLTSPAEAMDGGLSAEEPAAR